MLLTVLLLLAADPVPAPQVQIPAPTATAPAAAAKKPAADAGDEVVCHAEQVIGSRFKRTVCGRKSDFEKRRAADQQQLRQNTAPGFLVR